MNKTHGLYQSAEYYAYHAMKQRCYNPKNPEYKNYGARGIRVSQEWLKSFLNFYADMGPKPASNLSLERKNNFKGYSNSNCRWATPAEQNLNFRRNKIVTFKGQSMPAKSVMEKTGMSSNTDRNRIYRRLRDGWSHEDAFLVPVISKFTIKKYRIQTP